ncbi:hypothetical protein OG21DRAFT_1490403 [Imleria badia]|nr:hypothetical protein OG21DRAFT_1490403 [Imleria badia]
MLDMHTAPTPTPMPITATSSPIRTLLSSPRLCAIATTNALRGSEREEALQRALGVDSRLFKNQDDARTVALDEPEDTRAFRALTEAIEGAVRGVREDVLGLD